MPHWHRSRPSYPMGGMSALRAPVTASCGPSAAPASSARPLGSGTPTPIALPYAWRFVTAQGDDSEESLQTEYGRYGHLTAFFVEVGSHLPFVLSDRF